MKTTIAMLAIAMVDSTNSIPYGLILMDRTQTLSQIGKYCLQHNLTISTAESCTAGLLAAAFTSLAGSSEWYEGGYITYRLSAKRNLLNVGADTLVTYGAVSSEVAQQMVSAAHQNTQSNIAVATTGLAGPGDDGTTTAVGTLWIAWLWPTANGLDHQLETQQFELPESRSEFRRDAVDLALTGLHQRLFGQHSTLSDNP